MSHDNTILVLVSPLKKYTFETRTLKLSRFGFETEAIFGKKNTFTRNETVLQALNY